MSRSTQGHHLNKLWWGQGPNATYQGPRSLALWFRRRRFLKDFYYIWAWRPSWSCYPDAPNKLLFPRPMEAPQEIWLRLAQRFWRRRSLKMVDGRQRTTEGRRACLYYKLTNEPKCSGELKTKRAIVFILAHDTRFDRLSSPAKFH